MSLVVRKYDLHLLAGTLVSVPQKTAFHRGLEIATTGSITIPPVIPACCAPVPCAPICCVPNISLGSAKVYIHGLPVVKAGDMCVPCGMPSISFQSHFSTV